MTEKRTVSLNDPEQVAAMLMQTAGSAGQLRIALADEAASPPDMRAVMGCILQNQESIAAALASLVMAASSRIVRPV